MKPLALWREKRRAAAFLGHEIAYWRTDAIDAAKPWLILVHGYPTSSWDWSGLWDRLEARFNLLAVDMLGFGLSAKPKRHDYSILEQASLIEDIAVREGISSAHLFAHDYGDTVAQEMIARHNDGASPIRLQSCCFLNGGIFPEQHRARLVQKLGLTPAGFLLGLMLTKAKLRKSFDEIFGPDTPAADEEIDTHWAFIEEHEGARVLHRLLQYIPERREHRERWVGALQSATIPLRLINGGADPVSGKHAYEHYLKLIPNADAVLFPAIGHYPHTEAPDLVFDAFSEFHDSMGARS